MELYEATGTPLFAMSPLSKIIWLKKNEPAVFLAAHKFISIKEYVWYKLFGAFQVDHSIASGTGLLDVHTLGWSKLALASAGITESHLSEPVSTHYLRRDFSAEP